MKKYKCYMAGPAVFAPDHKEWAEAVVYNCSGTIIEPLIPADGDVESNPVETLANRIYQKNIEMMKEADICIADISPFRGVSGDAGTLFEVGYMTALGKPVFLYSDLKDLSYKRRADGLNAMIHYPSPIWCWLCDDWLVEDFGLTENLMITQTGTVVYDCVQDAIEAANKLLNRH